VSQIKEFLGSSLLFENLTEPELEKLAELGQEEVYEVGETIVREGVEINRLYIVKEGRVVIELTLRLGSGPGRQGVIDVISEGRIFGWWGRKSYSLLESARCIEKTKVIVLDGLALWTLLEEDNVMGYKVMKRLVGVVSSRLEYTRDTLANILSIASHDLKAPLAAVESYHQVILGGFAGETTEKQRTMLLRSSVRIKGLLNLIDNILDISRIDARVLKMEATSVLKVIESTWDTVQPLAQIKGVELRVELPEELPLIAGAPERLQQVFTNLLGNAVKFTPEGGVVILKVSEKDDNIVTVVTDTGVGIPSEELPRIFDDFYRGIRVDEAGTGLGLSISKKIIEAHDGKIWAESPCPDTGKGSRFTFILPKSGATM
jgi:signal transduction histidine kinase